MADLPDLDLVTDGGIPYALVEGPSLEHSADRTAGREVYRIAAANVEAFLLESIPPPVIIGRFVQIAPRRRMPDYPFLITQDVSSSPWIGDANPVGQRWARVEISYEAALESEENERDPNDPITFLEVSVNSGFESMNIPGHSVNWIDDDVGHPPGLPGGPAAEPSFDVNAGVQKIIPTTELTLRWPYAYRPDWEFIEQAKGKLNDAVSPVFLNAPIECVQFVGYSGNQKFVWAGGMARAELWSLDFHFSIRVGSENGRTYGWNHAYRPESRKFELAFRDQGGDLVPLYETTNLLNLFRSAE